MNPETKVGLFALLGILVAGFSIMKLGDINLRKQQTFYFVFDDVGQLRDQSVVKVSGVEVGRISKIELEESKAKITARISPKVPLYADASVKVKQTGLIGSMFIDLTPGTPAKELLPDRSTIQGARMRSFDELLEKLSQLFESKNGQPAFSDDLKATMANLRSLSGTLDDVITGQKRELKDIVLNLQEFSVDLKGMASDLHQLTSSKKADIEDSITKLHSILGRLDTILAKVQEGEGAIGKLVYDKGVGEDVKQTVANLKQTSESAKDVLGRFTKIRSFWEFEGRYVPGAETVRGDGGIRLQPRPDKYYYLGVNNAGDRKNEYKNEGDYEKMNTITAVLGKIFGPVTLEAGAIRSSAGLGLKYVPFEKSESFVKNIELNAQAFDFGRDEVRGRGGREKEFKGPQFNIGARYKVTRFVQLGASVEDLAKNRQYNVNTRLVFEDKDLAYLFGFVSFAR